MSLSDKFVHRTPGQKTLDSWPLPDCEPIDGETIRADGWTYGDLPRLSHAEFDQFIEVVGQDNLKWLSFADAPTYRRGQYFISPTGTENLDRWLETQRN